MTRNREQLLHQSATELAELAAVLIDVDAAVALLPPEERAEYARCQQSVIDARRYAERHAHEHWIG